MNVKVEQPGENNVHNNAFYAEETLLRSELEAMRDCNPLTARHWIVRHPYSGIRAVLLTVGSQCSALTLNFYYPYAVTYLNLCLKLRWQ